ncbi:endonuclease MutS2 [Candidatus Poribacteria bacterium]|jgi:DNA mismatch repair protein MutS2|nr:endonuclease MutS2 [Candidatus Poribacteria bacterium]MBT5712837.1 endonuclease MutS2 [Candidatus Poribacteria bacterium]MBT7099370.1 endonuclease MutS2 [Candidatus Poribacteria bacterium]MBT7803897.1 endonuclease MutS2 [Candidatus Poribacteria bacterium]
MRFGDSTILEYGKFTEVLSGYAVSTPGKARVGDMFPSTDPCWIRRELTACDEMVEIQGSPSPLVLHGLHDVTTQIMHLAKGGVLDAESLLAVAKNIGVAARVRVFLDKLDIRDAYPTLAGRTSLLVGMPSVLAVIDRVVSAEGEVRDNASDELGRIRSQLRRTRDRIQNHLDSILQGSTYERALQERVVTIRNGRYVIPVKQDFSGTVRGVMQGQSSSGLTVFVEPMPVVEMNNKLNELFGEEEREVARILAATSDALREHVDDLRNNADALTELDFLRAKANYSLDYRCRAPIVPDAPRVDLRGARHPLLERLFREERASGQAPEGRAVIPLTVCFDDPARGIVITGPNTGGKTVALKTLGLLAAVAQSGMHIPVEKGTALGVFDEIYADIGDEQSIEQSLSTFSSHMTKIIRVVKEATPKALVLFDEVGAGTDPVEGAALATSIIDDLVGRGAHVMVTTHHGALKVYAHEHERIINAAMQFDEASLEPTYHLISGTPGSSHALRVTERLGMPSSVLQVARDRVGSGAVEMERLIEDVDRLRRELDAERRLVHRTLGRAEAKRTEHETRAEELRVHKADLKRRASEEADAVLRDARGLVERTVADLRRTSASKESIATAHRDIAAARVDLRGELAHAPTESGDPVDPLREGDLVHIKDMRTDGVVLSDYDGSGAVRVRAGSLTVTVRRGEVERREPSALESMLPKKYRAMASEKRSTISADLHLIGMRAGEALDETDKYLDDATLSGLDKVSIVHGKGTGALRRALHEHFRAHPQVSEFRLGTLDEGGAGVTMVTLRD